MNRHNLLADVLRYMPRQQILYLHSDLESFLISNLKKTSDTQQKMPGLAREFLADGSFAQRFPQIGAPSRLEFLQVCALIWLVNLNNFKEAAEQHGTSQVRTLDARVFLGDFPSTLSSLNRFFGHVPEPDEVQRMMDPQVIRTNAKDQSIPYGNEQRQFETRQLISRHSAASWPDPVWVSETRS